MHNKSIALSIVTAISFLFGWVFLALGPGLAFLFCVPIFLFFILHKNPYYFLIGFLVVSLDFFGYIDPERFMSLPGVFKLKDIIFILGFCLVFLELIVRKGEFKINKDSPILIFLFILLILLITNWIRTYYLFEVDFKSIFQYSRRYLFYFSYFFPLCFIKSEKELKQFLKIIFVLASVYSVLILVQFILGSKLNILGYTTVVNQTFSGINLPRIYFKGIVFLCLVLGSSVGYYFYSKKKAKYILFGICIIFCAILSHLSRMFWIYLLLLMIFWSFKLPKKNLTISFLLIGIMVTVFSVNLTSSNSTNSLLSHSFTSISDVIENRGTFKYRLDESWFRFDLIKKHPILGPGFIHPKHLGDIISLANNERPDLANVDVGWIAICTDFGIVGVVVIIGLVFSLIFYEKKFIKSYPFSAYRGVKLGIICFMASGLIISLTHGFFTFDTNIITIGIALGIWDRINVLSYERVSKI